MLGNRSHQRLPPSTRTIKLDIAHSSVPSLGATIIGGLYFLFKNLSHHPLQGRILLVSTWLDLPPFSAELRHFLCRDHSEHQFICYLPYSPIQLPLHKPLKKNQSLMISGSKGARSRDSFQRCYLVWVLTLSPNKISLSTSQYVRQSTLSAQGIQRQLNCLVGMVFKTS